MLTPLDDYPYHQITDVMRHVGTTDRRFYDRYFFTCNSGSADFHLIFGYAQYPNLGVCDAYASAWMDGTQYTVRASRELGFDRTDISVGPFKLEVIEGLRELRFTLGKSEGEVEFDLTWTEKSPPRMEPPHKIWEFERAVIDTARYSQSGGWSGKLTIAGREFEASADSWGGFRDHSWGVREVGERVPKGIERSKPTSSHFWCDAAAWFDDYTLFIQYQEEGEGNRQLEEAIKVWHDPEREIEHLGKPAYEYEFRPGTREVTHARISFEGEGASPLVLEAETHAPLNLAAGTGYASNPERDWAHGMYQGELVVQGRTYDMSSGQKRLSHRHGHCENVAHYTFGDESAWGWLEIGIFGPHKPTGFETWRDVAGEKPGERVELEK